MGKPLESDRLARMRREPWEPCASSVGEGKEGLKEE